MNKKVTIDLHKRKWSNISLLYVVEQMREANYRGSYVKESLVLRRRSDYFYIEQPPGNGLVFIPDSFYREMWDVLCLILILYQNFMILYLLCFTDSSHRIHFIALTAIDFLFICEILLNFNTGYFANGVLVKHRKKIFKSYLRSYFIFDVLACVPFQLCISSMQFDDKPNVLVERDEYLKFLWILKLSNNNKLFKIIHNFQCRVSSELLYSLFHVFKFIISAVIIIHWMTCLMYLFFLKDFYDSGMRWFYIYDMDVEVYLKFCYMIVFTATSTGYGDIVPYTTGQKILCICIMGLTCWLFAFILTNIKEIFLKYTSLNNYYKEIIFRLKKYSIDNGLSRNLRLRVTSYLQYIKENTKKKNFGEENILKILSGPLKEEVYIVTRGNILHKCPVFMHYSQDFLRFLIRHLDHSIYAPGDKIFKEGEEGDKIYFIISGRIDIYHNSTETSFKELEASKYFGEIGFFLGQKRVASARSLIFSELFYLSRHRMNKLLMTKRNDLEVHKIFILQCKDNIALLAVKCYLCLKLGHVSKDCKKFVIVIDAKELAKKSDNKRYELNKSISDIRYIQDDYKQGLGFYNKEMAKGCKKSLSLRYKDAESLKDKCDLYIRENKKINYKKAAHKKRIFDAESEASVHNKSYSNLLTITKDAWAQSNEEKIIFNNSLDEVKWEDIEEGKTITFRAPQIKLSQLN